VVPIGGLVPNNHPSGNQEYYRYHRGAVWRPWLNGTIRIPIPKKMQMAIKIILVSTMPNYESFNRRNKQ
jgi:hypothetical protein